MPLTTATAQTRRIPRCSPMRLPRRRKLSTISRLLAGGMPFRQAGSHYQGTRATARRGSCRPSRRCSKNSWSGERGKYWTSCDAGSASGSICIDIGVTAGRQFASDIGSHLAFIAVCLFEALNSIRLHGRKHLIASPPGPRTPAMWTMHIIPLNPTSLTCTHPRAILARISRSVLSHFRVAHGSPGRSFHVTCSPSRRAFMCHNKQPNTEGTTRLTSKGPSFLSDPARFVLTSAIPMLISFSWDRSTFNANSSIETTAYNHRHKTAFVIASYTFHSMTQVIHLPAFALSYSI